MVMGSTALVIKRPAATSGRTGEDNCYFCEGVFYSFPES